MSPSRAKVKSASEKKKRLQNRKGHFNDLLEMSPEIINKPIQNH